MDENGNLVRIPINKDDFSGREIYLYGTYLENDFDLRNKKDLYIKQNKKTIKNRAKVLDNTIRNNENKVRIYLALRKEATGYQFYLSTATKSLDRCLTRDPVQLPNTRYKDARGVELDVNDRNYQQKLEFFAALSLSHLKNKEHSDLMLIMTKADLTLDHFGDPDHGKIMPIWLYGKMIAAFGRDKVLSNDEILSLPIPNTDVTFHSIDLQEEGNGVSLQDKNIWDESDDFLPMKLMDMFESDNPNTWWYYY